MKKLTFCMKLADLPELEDLSFYGNPIHEQLMAAGEWVQKERLEKIITKQIVLETLQYCKMNFFSIIFSEP